MAERTRYVYAGVHNVGRFKIRKRDYALGTVGPWRDCGAANSAKVDPQVSEVTDPNTMTMARGNLYAAYNTDGVNFEIVLKDWFARNLMLTAAGSRTDNTATTITNEIRTAVEGEYISWERVAKFTKVEKDVSGTFEDAVEGVDFERGNTGITALVAGEFRFTGTLPATLRLEALTAIGDEYEVLMEFQNLRNKGKTQVWHLHRCVFSPTSNDLMSEGATLTLSGKLLADLSKGEGESAYFYIDGELE